MRRAAHLPTHSVQGIRRRLYSLLLRAFVAVVLLTVLLLTGAAVSYLTLTSSGERPMRPSLVAPLQAYYLGHGGWEGIGSLVEDIPVTSPYSGEPDWWQAIVLDENNQVLIDRGRTDTPLVGQTLASGRPASLSFPIIVDGRQVGTVVYTPNNPLDSLRLFAPIGVLAFFLGVLTLVIGLALTNRVVAPLADVIAAARAVAQGDLAAVTHEQIKPHHQQGKDADEVDQG